MTTADCFAAPIPRACLRDEHWRRHWLEQMRATAALRGYRGRIRFARQTVIGPPGGVIVMVQVHVA